MPTRPCLGPAPSVPCPTRALVHAPPHSKTAARCGYCQHQWQQAKDARRPERRIAVAINRNAQAVTDWVNTHGWWCPGINGDVEPHMSRDLTADHIQAVALTNDEAGALTVRCRSCNSKLGARLASR